MSTQQGDQQTESIRQEISYPSQSRISEVSSSVEQQKQRQDSSVGKVNDKGVKTNMQYVAQKQVSMIIAVEGCDKVGKTTMVKYLTQYLQCDTIKFPIERVDQFGSMMSFQQSCYRELVDYQHHINDCNTIIIDRYIDSYKVYSKLNTGITMNTDKCLQADITILLDQRVGIHKHYNADDIFERVGYQTMVNRSYCNLYKQTPFIRIGNMRIFSKEKIPDFIFQALVDYDNMCQKVFGK